MKVTYRRSRVAPSHLVTDLSMVTKMYRIVTSIIAGIVNVIASFDIVKSPIIADIPIAPNTLNMFDPTTLPIAMSDFPFKPAITETISSGREVPSATTVIAIISALTLNIFAISIIDLTVQSADTYIRAPKMISSAGYFIPRLVFSFSFFTAVFSFLTVFMSSSPIPRCD